MREGGGSSPLVSAAAAVVLLPVYSRAALGLNGAARSSSAGVCMGDRRHEAAGWGLGRGRDNTVCGWWQKDAALSVVHSCTPQLSAGADNCAWGLKQVARVQSVLCVLMSSHTHTTWGALQHSLMPSSPSQKQPKGSNHPAECPHYNITSPPLSLCVCPHHHLTLNPVCLSPAGLVARLRCGVWHKTRSAGVC